MLLTVAYLPAKLPSVCVCVLFCFLRAVISAVWPFCPVEHLFYMFDFICITSDFYRLCSQINDDDDDDEMFWIRNGSSMALAT